MRAVDGLFQPLFELCVVENDLFRFNFLDRVEGHDKIAAAFHVDCDVAGAHMADGAEGFLAIVDKYVEAFFDPLHVYSPAVALGLL